MRQRVAKPPLPFRTVMLCIAAGIAIGLSALVLIYMLTISPAQMAAGPPDDEPATAAQALAMLPDPTPEPLADIMQMDLAAVHVEKAIANTEPERTPAPTKQSSSLQSEKKSKKQKRIALTFDDGPRKATTGKLLDILKKQGVKATFFMIGRNVGSNAALVKRMVREGHAIGTHTQNHRHLTKLSAEGVRNELNSSISTIKKACGQAPTCFRPPYGELNATVKSVAAKLGLPIILWDVDPSDWKNRNAGAVFSQVVGPAHSGSIVLLHDVHPTTVQAAERIIKNLKSNGYTFVTIAELLPQSKAGKVYFKGTKP